MATYEPGYSWDDENPLILYINGEEINLETKGVEYAKQFGQLTSWLGRYALPALMSAAEQGTLDEAGDFNIAVQLMSNFMDLGFSPESIIELSGILINKDRAFVEENFDPGWFIEALLRSYDHREGVRTAFARLYERFFLATSADAGDEEDQAQD